MRGHHGGVLTVRYDRLGLRPGDRLLDLGCGVGRHAFEAYRRGARVVPLDADAAELKDAAAILSAMDQAGEAGPGAAGEPESQSPEPSGQENA